MLSLEIKTRDGRMEREADTHCVQYSVGAVVYASRPVNGPYELDDDRKAPCATMERHARSGRYVAQGSCHLAGEAAVPLM